MAKQTFTTGQVLTSAEMTALQLNDYNQTVSAKTANYVLVAADAGTRITMSNAGATTITVNTSLFAAGDSVIITNIGAGASTITAGTATVSTVSTLVLSQYDSGQLYFTSTGVAIWQKYAGAAGGSAGLTKITTSPFTTVASVSVNNCFSASYKKYRVIIKGIANAGLYIEYLKLRASGTDASSGYSWGAARVNFATGAVTGNSGSAATSGWNMSSSNVTYNFLISMDITDPFTASATTMVFQSSSPEGAYADSGGGVHTTATSYDGLTLIVSAGSISGEIEVFGYAD